MRRSRWRCWNRASWGARKKFPKPSVVPMRTWPRRPLDSASASFRSASAAPAMASACASSCSPFPVSS